jgi:glycerol uptake facilitator protein
VGTYLPLERNQRPTTKLAVFATGPAIRKPWSNLVSEIIGTFVLIIGVLVIGANKFSEGLNPLVVGLLVVAIGYHWLLLLVMLLILPAI